MDAAWESLSALSEHEFGLLMRYLNCADRSDMATRLIKRRVRPGDWSIRQASYYRIEAQKSVDGLFAGHRNRLEVVVAEGQAGDGPRLSLGHKATKLKCLWMKECDLQVSCDTWDRLARHFKALTGNRLYTYESLRGLKRQLRQELVDEVILRQRVTSNGTLFYLNVFQCLKAWCQWNELDPRDVFLTVSIDGRPVTKNRFEVALQTRYSVERCSDRTLLQAAVYSGQESTEELSQFHVMREALHEAAAASGRFSWTCDLKCARALFSFQGCPLCWATYPTDRCSDHYNLWRVPRYAATDAELQMELELEAHTDVMHFKKWCKEVVNSTKANVCLQFTDAAAGRCVLKFNDRKGTSVKYPRIKDAEKANLTGMPGAEKVYFLFRWLHSSGGLKRKGVSRILHSIKSGSIRLISLPGSLSPLLPIESFCWCVLHARMRTGELLLAIVGELTYGTWFWERAQRRLRKVGIALDAHVTTTKKGKEVIRFPSCSGEAGRTVLENIAALADSLPSHNFVGWSHDELAASVAKHRLCADPHGRTSLHLLKLLHLHFLRDEDNLQQRFRRLWGSFVDVYNLITFGKGPHGVDDLEQFVEHWRTPEHQVSWFRELEGLHSPAHARIYVHLVMVHGIDTWTKFDRVNLELLGGQDFERGNGLSVKHLFRCTRRGGGRRGGTTQLSKYDLEKEEDGLEEQYESEEAAKVRVVPEGDGEEGDLDDGIQGEPDRDDDIQGEQTNIADVSVSSAIQQEDTLLLPLLKARIAADYHHRRDSMYM
jgi:hypothetical protein